MRTDAQQHDRECLECAKVVVVTAATVLISHKRMLVYAVSI